jgi:hypothetical protein
MSFGGKIDKFGASTYVHITARDKLDDVLSVEMIPQEESTTELNLAQDLETIGQPVNIGSLEYNFIERIGGSLDVTNFDTAGMIWTGSYFSHDGDIYKQAAGDTDQSNPNPTPDALLLSDSPSYVIKYISPSRRELVIDKKSFIKEDLYNVQFSNLRYDDDSISRICNGYYFEDFDIDSKKFIKDPSRTSGYIPKDVWLVFTAGESIKNVELEIPNFFITGTEEVEEIITTTEQFKEPKPEYIPNIATDGTESTYGQWEWKLTGSLANSWVQKIPGMDDNNNVWGIELIPGYPLVLATNPGHFDSGTPLIPQYSLSQNQSTLANVANPVWIKVTSKQKISSGISNFKLEFEGPFKTWFQKNVIGRGFISTDSDWVRAKSSLSELEGDANAMLALYDSGGANSIEGLTNFLSTFYYAGGSDGLYTRTVETIETKLVPIFESFKTKLTDVKVPVDDSIDHVVEFGFETSVREYAVENGIDLDQIIGINDDRINDTELAGKLSGGNLILNFTNILRDVANLDLAVMVNKQPYTITNKIFAENKLLVKLPVKLPTSVDPEDDVIFVKKVFSSQNFPVNYVTYQAPPPPTNILRLPTGLYKSGKNGTIRPRASEALSYEDLIFESSSIAKDIERDIVSGSFNQVELNIDYSNYDKFLKFSSARRRLENFKTKLEKIESYTDKSASIAGTLSDTGYLGNVSGTAVTHGAQDAKNFEVAINEVVIGFDGYERYLYFASSSYESGSAGLYYDASWPKTNSSKPYTLLDSENSTAIDWYNEQHTSASTYDTENLDRLIYHLPDHIRDDLGNQDFIKFTDMVGQHFDNLKNYIDRFGQVYETDEALDKGLSKQLVYNVAKSFGWTLEDGYDLVKLDKYLFGKTVNSSNDTTLYASSSLQDTSREIWKRIIANMPYFLKSRGTVDALKGLVNCYGIPSTILRVREFGGPTINDVDPIYETGRRFTKAIDFKAGQFVSSSWSSTLGLGGTQVPNSMEFRFKAASSSNMTIVQGGGLDANSWGVHLRDNGSDDNYGRIVFSLSGSVNDDTKIPSTETYGSEAVSTYATMSSDALPLYNNDYWSVLLRRSPISGEMIGDAFESASFGGTISAAAGTKDFPFAAAENGVLTINSASAYTRADSTYSLRLSHTVGTTTLANDTKVPVATYTYPYRNPGGNIDSYGTAGYRDARFVTASFGQEFSLEVWARTEEKTATVALSVQELDSVGKTINWNTKLYPNESTPNDYGVHEVRTGVGTTWKRLSLKFPIKQRATANLSLQLSVLARGTDVDNIELNPNVYFDDGSLKRIFSNTTTDTGYTYDLIVKQWDAGRDAMLYSDGVSKDFLTSVSSSFNNKFAETGSMYIGGYTTKDFGGQFSGSLMEFRLWKSALDEKPFNEHVENPQSYAGNSVSASYEDIALRYSFNEDKNHSDVSSVRDTSTDQSTPITGIATSFADENNYSDVVDRTKFPLPKIGGIRTNANKIRIEKPVYQERVGQQIQLSPTHRIEESSYDRSPLDLNRVGVYFSPVDVINQDIMDQMSDFNFDNYLGDSRDDKEYRYRGLEQIKEEYFKKYTGANNFYDYLRTLEYYDHSLFRQLESLIPARSKAVLGVLVENNILERNKQPINHPTQENPVFESTVYFNSEDGETVKQSSDNQYFEVSQSVTRLDKEMDPDATYAMEGENQYFEDTVDTEVGLPSLRDLNRVDKFGHFGRNYTTASIYTGGPTSVFTESIAYVENQRISDYNKEKHYIYSSKANYVNGTASSVSFVTSSFERLTEYISAQRRINFEGCKNDVNSAPWSIDENGEKDYKPVSFILTSPTRLAGDARDSVVIRTEFDVDE